MITRHHSFNVGRFLSAEPGGNEVGSSQSWNRYSYALGNPVNNTDPTGEDTVVALQFYVLGSAPIQGDYGHQYVYLRDTDTGETMISRAGPGAPYPGESSAVAAGSPVKDPNGSGNVVLQTSMTPEAKSIDAGQGGKTVTGSTTTLKQPIGDVAGKLQTFNDAVDAAKIDYKPRSDNSNAYGGTAYAVVTGKTPPSSHVLPGSDVDLRPKIPECSSNPEVCGGESAK